MVKPPPNLCLEGCTLPAPRREGRSVGGEGDSRVPGAGGWPGMLRWEGLPGKSCWGGSPTAGALVDLLRRRGSSRHSRGFDSFTAARAPGLSVARQGHGPGEGGSPRAPLSPAVSAGAPSAATGCRVPATERVPVPAPCTRMAAAAARGPPRPSRFSCCLQELISAWTSLTSRRFFFYWLLECARLA